jgi:hypothetical protein
MKLCFSGQTGATLMPQSAKATPGVQSLLWNDLFDKPVAVEFTAERQTENAGLLLFGAVDRRMGLTQRIAAGLRDRRDPDLVTHTQHDLLRQRVYGLLGGFADCNDAARLRDDPVFRLLLGRALDDPEEALASQPTFSRFENQLHMGSLLRWGCTLADTVLAMQRRRRKHVKRITLDLEPTDDAPHGEQQLSFFNTYYDEHCYLPLLGFATFHDQRNAEEPERYLLAALLRPGNAAASAGLPFVLRRLVARCRAVFPEAVIRVRLDGAYATPEVFALLEGELRVEYVVNMGKNAVLKRAAEPALQQARLRAVLSGQTERVFAETRYAAETWGGVQRRTIIKAEVTLDPRDERKELRDNPRFVVTNLKSAPEHVYRHEYCPRGAMEKEINELKAGLFMDRTSCSDFKANQVRVLLAATAYVLVQELRTRSAKTAAVRWEVNTLRARVVKIAAVVCESTRRWSLKLSRCLPDRELWARLARCAGAAAVT